jgi:hypothetical protein
MKINRIAAVFKSNDYCELKEEFDYKKSKNNSKSEQLSFAEILKKEKENSYLKCKN